MKNSSQGRDPPQKTRSDDTDWALVLVWLMRIAAVLWLVKGLGNWFSIMGLGPEPFEALARPAQGATVAFAVGQLIAAVGLWLTASWGGVLFLFMAIAEVMLSLLAPEVMRMAPGLLAVIAALVLAYLAVAYRAARSVP